MRLPLISTTKLVWDVFIFSSRLHLAARIPPSCEVYYDVLAMEAATQRQGKNAISQDVIGLMCLLQKGIKNWDEQAAVAYEHRWEFR